MRSSLSGKVGGLLCALLALAPCFAQDAATPPAVLTLDHAVEIAIANNRNLKIAALDVDKSKWQIASAKADRLPMAKAYLFASGDLTSPTFTFPAGIFGPINGVPVPAQSRSISLSSGVTGNAYVQVAQPLSQLYKIHLFIREQQLSSELSSQQYRAKRQSLVADVKQAYYAALQTESALDVAQASVKQYEETDRVATNYLNQEAVLKSETLDVKAKLAQSRYQVIQLNDTLQTQKEHLNDLLGRDIATDFRTEQVPALAWTELDLKAAQQTALEQRPEIQQAEINIKRADYDRKLAQAQYIPDVGAALHYLTPINTSILPTNILAAGLELSWNPWDWGKRHDDVKQKQITVEQAQFQLKDAQSKVLLDVNSKFRKLAESRVLLQVAQAARDAANEKLKEVSDKFKQEAVLLRDLMQQQTAVANADHDYEEALLSFWSAKADFEKALGEE